ncbi:hypothetical protein HNV11_20105 [Spirosoma taeanense]|uniref:Uncharacterized protein n=1 Tax=Spirosoma taeanense TaxID=2735870 RepID=A0A6M5YBK7_9BACT|nr:hypothetical protein [Spirosoma taeanense]QJW91518.1 hypothetical protein HNV11_20105 [Spirosoma taeanense]
MLYVDQHGNVFIECVTGGWTENRLKDLLFRFEVFPQGWGYVGSAAAEDDSHLTTLYAALLHNWQAKTTGCINSW